MSRTKETKEFKEWAQRNMVPQLDLDFRNEEKAQALRASIRRIVDRVLTDVQGCGRDDCELDFEHYVFKDADHPSIKGRPEYVGKTSVDLMEDEIAEEILALLKKMHEIDSQ